MKDHKREDVVELAEKIFAQNVDADRRFTNDKVKQIAGYCFTAAMLFREAEDEVFTEIGQ